MRCQGRNADEQVKMIERVREYNSKQEEKNRITISVEIEKTREPLYQLFPLGDLVWLLKLFEMYYISNKLHMNKTLYVIMDIPHSQMFSVNWF